MKFFSGASDRSRNFPLRFATVDRIIICGWVILLLTGQFLLPVTVRPLEYLAIAWLWLGILLVRRTVCIPLLMLTCCAFMCENRRAWAWVQPVTMWLFFGRILLENKWPLRRFLYLCLAAVIVFALSWPRNAGELLAGVAAYERSKVLGYWMGPQAVWSIFSFRQCVDRALVAAVCTGTILAGGYFSSRRLWQALWLCAVVSLMSALGAHFVPWHEPHKFLGTTNHATFGIHLFQGAGYNISFFGMCIAAGLPWFVFPLRSRWSHVRLGSMGLLFPAVLVHQRAFTYASLLMLAMVAAAAMFVAARRRRSVRSPEGIAGRGRKAFAVFLVCTCVSVLWYVRLGVFDSRSMLRSQLGERLGTAFSLDMSPFAEVPTEGDAGSAPEETEPIPEECVGKLPLKKRAARWLVAHDKIRGPMWVLGLRTCAGDCLWWGMGAGTWARYHRSQPRPYRHYYAHMHNTYLDLAFEYGVVPTALVLVLCGITVLKLVLVQGGANRLWVLYLVCVAVIALGQHVLFAFTTMCLLLPAFILIPKVLCAGRRGENET